jgi:5,10-methylenetetrahydromethanopterin reductase
MRLGIFTGGAGETDTLDSLITQAQQAETAGFASFWLPNLPTRNYDALLVLALAGRATTRIALGTAVMPTYPRHPIAMAQEAMTANAAARGRLALGIGLSHRPVIEDVPGLSYAHPARHMQEYLTVLQALLHDHKVAYTGETLRVTAEVPVPEPRPLPVLLAALAPRMLQLAGSMAEGTITWMAGVQTLATHVVPRLQAVTDDVAGAREAAGRLFERYGQLTNYRRLLDLEDAQGPADVAVIGNEGEVTRQLQALARAGATDFLAAIFPVGADAAGSRARTWELLRSLHETALTFEPSPAVLSAVTPRPAGPRRVHTGSQLA